MTRRADKRSIPSRMSVTAAMLLLAGCGQIGKLYLNYPPVSLTPVVTTNFAPAVALLPPVAGTISSPPATTAVPAPPVSTVEPAQPLSGAPPSS